MAAKTSTYTANLGASILQVPANQAERGVQSIMWDYNSGTVKIGTVSDVVLLGKLPGDCVIENLKFTAGVIASTAAVASLLLLVKDPVNDSYSTYATLIAAMTFSAAAQSFTLDRPLKISLSDDRQLRWLVLAANFTSGTETVSTSMYGYLNYTCDSKTTL